MTNSRNHSMMNTQSSKARTTASLRKMNQTRPRSKSWNRMLGSLSPGKKLGDDAADDVAKKETVPLITEMSSLPLIGSKTIAAIKSDIRSDLRISLKQDYDEQLAESKGRIARLERDLHHYKQKTGALEKDLDDKIEINDIKRGDMMTQSSCKWFAILMIAHLVFYFLYYKVRGSGDDLDEALSQLVQIRRLSIYSAIYVFVFLFDVFWTVLLPDKVTCERTTADTHVIVAAHRAHESLEVMLPSVLKRFEAYRVHVADNGFHDERTQELCERLGIHYHFNPVGNKANALLVVARKIQREYGASARNVVLLDDDTVLEDDFFIRHDLLSDPKVGGYCVAIGIDRSPPMNLWEIAIDYEYRAISYAFGARATCSTIPFIHGICAVYKLDLLVDLYEKNWSLPGGLPFGEDGYAGLDFRTEGYKLLQDNHNLVLTFCPRRFLPPLCASGRVQGYGASSLWKQRAARWFLSWPRQIPGEFWLAFTYDAGTWYGNIQYRVYFLWWLFLNSVSVAWIPYLFYVYFKHESWILVLILKGMLTVTGIIVACLRILLFPRKLRRGLHILAPFTAPLLGMANAILRFAGFVFSIYWYIPFVRIGTLKVLGDESDVDIELAATAYSSSSSGDHIFELSSSEEGSEEGSISNANASSRDLASVEMSADDSIVSKPGHFEEVDLKGDTANASF